ncbi:MAG: RdgB/HAM1 family non-canonical purine NTP pyrophosphatase [Pseudomonadota bacterium]
MTTIVLASGNQKKLRELQAMLATKNVTFVPQTQFNVTEAIEDGLSFVENALIKARHASKATGLPAIADDSGLEVDALNGAPGIYSARFANIQGAGNSDDAANNTLLLEKLRDVPDVQRTARFQCVLVLMRFPDDPMPLVCQGSWEGQILHAARGSNGFGYDPLFFVPTHNCASAELAPEIKNSISHRAYALQQLLVRWPFANS